MSALPLLSISVFLPAVGALWSWRASDDHSAHRIARNVALAEFLLATALGVKFFQAEQSSLEEFGVALSAHGPRWHLGIDGLSAPFLPLVALIALVVLHAAPRAELHRRSVVALLLGTSCTVGVYTSLDLALLAGFWVASLAPGAMLLRGSHRDSPLAGTYTVFLIMGAVPIVLAVPLIAWARAQAGAPMPFELSGVGSLPVPAARQGLVFVLLALALVLRKAVVPFHSWMPVLVERGPAGLITLIVGTHLGAFLVARVLIPLLPQASQNDLPLLAGVGLFSALYNSFLSLAQPSLRRSLAFVMTSQLALVLVGFASLNADSVHGAMLQMLLLGLASTGLVLLSAGVEARLGTTEFSRTGGLAGPFPKMAGAFLLLALASIGTPGTLGYVAEDLLLHGLLGSHSILASLLLLVSVLNGVTLFRAFLLTFFGPSRDPSLVGPGVRDLLPRETLVSFGLAALVVAGGILPQPLLSVRRSAVERLVHGSTPAMVTGPSIEARH